MSERLRLFVACELSPEVKEALAAVQDELRRRQLDRLRWVRAEVVHLTLKFLGETPAEKVPAIEAALAAAVEGMAPFELQLGELGTFGDRRGPRVVWVGLGGELAAMKALQKRLESSMRALGYPPEKRPFSPHLTLARVPPPEVAPLAARLREAVAAVQVAAVGQRVTEVSLMRSILQAQGAVYYRVAAWPLG